MDLGNQARRHQDWKDDAAQEVHRARFARPQLPGCVECVRNRSPGGDLRPGWHKTAVGEEIEEKEETAGGFILAGASQDKTKKAQVLAVGEGIRSLNGDLITPSVTEGETVLVDALAGVPVKEDGQDLLIIREADVLAVVK